MIPFLANNNRVAHRMALVTRHQRQQELVRWQLQHVGRHSTPSPQSDADTGDGETCDGETTDARLTAAAEPERLRASQTSADRIT